LISGSPYQKKSEHFQRSSRDFKLRGSHGRVATCKGLNAPRPPKGLIRARNLKADSPFIRELNLGGRILVRERGRLWSLEKKEHFVAA